MFTVGDKVDIASGSIDANEGTVISTTDTESPPYSLRIAFTNTRTNKKEKARLTSDGRLWKEDSLPCIILQNPLPHFEL